MATRAYLGLALVAWLFPACSSAGNCRERNSCPCEEYGLVLGEDGTSCVEPDQVSTNASGGSTSSGGSSASETGGSSGNGGTNSSGGSPSTGGSGGNNGTGGTAGETATGGSGGTGGAMGGTGGSTGGSGGSLPCDGACAGDTPFCNDDNACVACLAAGDCSDGVCDTDAQQCVECLENTDCDEGVCDTDARHCVGCLNDDDCGARCDTDAQQCVECLENTDCDDSSASMCDSGVCSPCSTNDDCAHLADTTVCDSGECVQCTVAEEAVCGGTSCDPATSTCTETDVGSVDDCGRCVADSECIGGNQSDPDRRCVPMQFDGVAREGGYCLRRQAKTCSRPYAIGVNAPSLSGAAQESYCGIDQNAVTCEAVVDLFASRACPGGQDSECGCPRDAEGNCTASGQGGLCRTVGVLDNQCTYPCGVANDCPSGRTCVNQDPDFCQ